MWSTPFLNSISSLMYFYFLGCVEETFLTQKYENRRSICENSKYYVLIHKDIHHSFIELRVRLTSVFLICLTIIKFLNLSTETLYFYIG